MRKKVCFIILGMLMVLFYKQMGMAQEYDENLDEEYYDRFIENIEDSGLEQELRGIGKQYGVQSDISFIELYKLLLEGKVEEAIGEAMESFYESIYAEIEQDKSILAKLFVLVIIAAIFNNYSSIMKISYVGDQGFYITYLMIVVLLFQSFMMIYDVAEDTIYYIKDIMECLLPAFYMSLMLCTGLGTSQMVNSMFLWMLSVVEKLLLFIILPGIKIYFLIVVLNQINAKDRFSKLAGLLKQGIEFLLKMIVTGIIGLNMMKSILLPIYDNAKYNILQKGLSVVPGGTAISGLTTLLVGAGVLIKNSVGITAVVILLTLAGLPLLKIFCFYIVYKILTALIQPVSDKRVLTGIQGAADSAGILLRAAGTSIVLSVLSIAIVLLTTNVRLYAG